MKNKNNYFSVNRIALLGILIALAYVGRILLQFMPNVQPVTAILIIITLTMGTSDGLIVAIASIFLSNLMLGMGPWSFAQIVAYSNIVLFTGLIMKYCYRPQQRWARLLFAIYAFITGIAYGFIISLITVEMMSIESFWAYYLAGIPFDLMHGIGNFVFYLLLEPTLTPLINRQLQ